MLLSSIEWFKRLTLSSFDLAHQQLIKIVDPKMKAMVSFHLGNVAETQAKSSLIIACEGEELTIAHIQGMRRTLAFVDTGRDDSIRDHLVKLDSILSVHEKAQQLFRVRV